MVIRLPVLVADVVKGDAEPLGVDDEALCSIGVVSCGVEDRKRAGFGIEGECMVGLLKHIEVALGRGAADALGHDNVTGVLMPSQYSSQGSVTDAEMLARSLNIHSETITIRDVFQAFDAALEPVPVLSHKVTS